MGGKSDPPPPPDYSGVAAASEKSAELSYKLGKEQLEWAKQQYASDKVTSDRVVKSFLQQMDMNTANAGKDRERYESVYQPLEDDLVADAKSFASPERRAMEMGRAESTVAQQFEGQRNQALQQLESYGVDPTSTRYAALDVGVRAAQAAAQAAAGNQAGQYVDSTARALRSEAINVGKGYPGQIAASYGVAQNAGNGAVNNTLATTASGSNTMGNPTQWQGLGNQAVGIWGNTLNMGYQNQLAAYNAEQQQSSGIGSALGLIGGAVATKFLAGGGAVGDGDGDEAIYEHQPVHGGAAVPVAASPSMGGAVDDVPAMLNAGEFVLPKDVVQWFGEEKLQKMIEKARNDKAGAGAKPETKMAPAAEPAVDTTGNYP